MFWNKIKSTEYKELVERLSNIESSVNLMKIDLVLLEERLHKAISKKLVKKEEDKLDYPTKDIYGGMFLPDNAPTRAR